MIESDTLSRWQSALPFWVSVLLIPLIWATTLAGGWWIVLVPLSTWWVFAVLDRLTGLNVENADPDTPDSMLRWHILLTNIWAPIQFLTLYGLIWYVTRSDLSALEKFGVFFGMGVISGTVGINYSHELMHQKGRLETLAGRHPAGDGDVFPFPVRTPAGAPPPCRHPSRPGNGALQ